MKNALHIEISRASQHQFSLGSGLLLAQIKRMGRCRHKDIVIGRRAK